MRVIAKNTLTWKLWGLSRPEILDEIDVYSWERIDNESGRLTFELKMDRCGGGRVELKIKTRDHRARNLWNYNYTWTHNTPEGYFDLSGDRRFYPGGRR